MTAENNNKVEPSAIEEAPVAAGFPVVYFDGVGNVAVGPSVCKLEFYSSTPYRGPDGAMMEHRGVRQVMVIPTLAFFELIANSIQGTIDGAPAVNAAMQDSINGILRIVKNLKVPD